MIDRSRITLAVIVCAVAAGAGICAFWWLAIEQTARLDTARGRTLRALELPQDGRRVAQSFDEPAGGTDAVCIRVGTTWERSASVVVQLHADVTGTPGAVLARAIVETPAAADACLGLPVTSRGEQDRRLWLSVRAVSAERSSGAYVLATTEDGYPTGQLLVGDREVWGDAAIVASAPHSTRLRDATAWPRGVPRVESPAALAGILVAACAMSAALVLIASTLIGSPRTRSVSLAVALCLSLGVRALSLPPEPVVASRPALEGRTLIDDLWQADLQTMWPQLGQGFEVVTIDIGGVPARALYALPASEARWEVDVQTPTSLDTAVALREEAWSRVGDGVTFSVRVEAEGRQDVLWRGHVDPFFDPSARTWRNVTVRLDRYVGRTVTLVLETDAGPQGNAVMDAAVWREPVLRPSK